MRNVRRAIGVGVFVTAVVWGLSAVWALNEPTHEIINEEAARRSTLDGVLQNRLAMPKGIRTVLHSSAETNTALEWIQRGGNLEDFGTLAQYIEGQGRMYRHFHDPLRSWDRAGLRMPITFKFVLGIPRLEVRPRLTPYKSAVRWAHRHSGVGHFTSR